MYNVRKVTSATTWMFRHRVKVNPYSKKGSIYILNQKGHCHSKTAIVFLLKTNSNFFPPLKRWSGKKMRWFSFFFVGFLFLGACSLTILQLLVCRRRETPLSQDASHDIFRLGNPELNLHLWLACWGLGGPKVYDFWQLPPSPDLFWCFRTFSLNHS